MRLMPVFGAGRGGGDGGASGCAGGARTTGSAGAWFAKVMSWIVSSVVRRAISRPFRSAMSNLCGLSAREDSVCSSLPVEIVVQNLDRHSPRPPSGFLRDCDKDSRIWFPDEKALFSLPFKRVSVSEEVSYTGRKSRRRTAHLLFPVETPLMDQCTSRFELDNLRGVVKLYCFVLA